MSTKQKRVYPGNRFVSPSDLVKRLEGSKPHYPLLVSHKGNGSARYYSWQFPWKPAIEDRLAPENMPGRWTPDLISAELRQALMTLSKLPLRGCIPAGFISCMPQPLREYYEAYGTEEEQERRSPATTQDIARMDMALAWLSWVETRNDAIIVTAAAMGVSWRRIGRIVHRHHEHVKRRHTRALAAICGKLDKA